MHNFEYKNTIKNIDFFKGLDELIENNIRLDMALIDLPYAMTENEWDKEIDLNLFWEKINKVIKKDGAILLCATGIFSAKLIMSNPKYYKYDLIWQKDRPSGFLNAKRQPLRDTEQILVFYRKQPVYNPIFKEGKPLHGMGNKYKEKISNNNNYGAFKSNENPSANRAGDTKKYPRSFLGQYKRPHPPKHATQKPLQLFIDLVYMYSKPGDTILDCCMGYGTTALACLELGDRYYCGFELNKDYYELAVSNTENFIKKEA